MPGSDFSSTLQSIQVQKIDRLVNPSIAYKSFALLRRLLGITMKEAEGMGQASIRPLADAKGIVGTYIQEPIVADKTSNSIFGSAVGGPKIFSRKDILRFATFEWARFHTTPTLETENVEEEEQNPATVRQMILWADEFMNGFHEFLATLLYFRPAVFTDPVVLEDGLLGVFGRPDVGLKAINNMDYLISANLGQSCGGLVPSSIPQPTQWVSNEFSGSAYQSSDINILKKMITATTSGSRGPKDVYMPKELWDVYWRQYTQGQFGGTEVFNSKDPVLGGFDTLRLGKVNLIADEYLVPDITTVPGMSICRVFGIDPQFFGCRYAKASNKGFARDAWEKHQDSFNYFMTYRAKMQIVATGTRKFNFKATDIRFAT